jgi:hypothetical protein
MQQQIAVIGKEMAEIKKSSKLFSGLYSNAVQTARSKSISNKGVEPEPKHLLESLSISIMAEILPMLKTDLKQSEIDVARFVTVSKFS